MSSFFFRSILASGALLFACSQAWGQISTPEERAAALAKAERFAVVNPENVDGKYSEAINPFAPNVPAVETADTTVAAPRNEVEKLPEDSVVLQAISERLTPTGVMQVGSRVMMLFGERRVSAGDFIPIQYQGREYQIQVVAVSARTFTLRLNQETITKRTQ